MYELEFGLPWENPELWAELSPFNKVESITTPTLWMGGEVDWNVPINNSEQMYIAMKRLAEKPSWLCILVSTMAFGVPVFSGTASSAGLLGSTGISSP